MTSAGKSLGALPAVFAAALAAMVWTVSDTPALVTAFAGAAGLLVTWNAILLFTGRGREFQVDVVLRAQHYVQLSVQGAVRLYWGWYWPTAASSLDLLLAQVLFAYGFDLLLGWSRRDRYTLGFGPVPVVFSINLFLWFKPEWFAWQFVIVAAGLLVKEFVRWERDGKLVHIFNPSSFPLAIASLVLLFTGTTHLTWGPEIATTQFYPPQMYLMLFLVGLPGQVLFGVASMTASAVLSTYLFGLVYFYFTGIYFFYDSYIPIAVFLGMHLLFTDPSTAPRTELGRVIFGCLYGLSTVALYQGLGMLGLPTFYDKLLQVPVLNLMVRWLDRVAKAPALQWVNPARVLPAVTGRVRHAAYAGVWVLVFAGMSVAQGVGDRHAGQWLPFWRQACSDDRAFACPYLADMTASFCRRGSAWGCNEEGLLHLALARSGEDLRRQDPQEAEVPLRRGCELGLAAACENLRVLITGQGSYRRVAPSTQDWPIVLRGSKGEVTERDPNVLVAMACGQGWVEACAQPARAVE